MSFEEASGTCLCRTERMFYRFEGQTREAPGGLRWRCAKHAAEGRARDKWVRAWLTRNYPQRLALPAPEVQ